MIMIHDDEDDRAHKYDISLDGALLEIIINSHDETERNAGKKNVIRRKKNTMQFER